MPRVIQTLDRLDQLPHLRGGADADARWCSRLRLRQDVTTELNLFLRSILLEDKNVEELLTADYTFLN